MLRGAKIKWKLLLFDDSGIALAFTLVVFLFLALMIMSVYALGHTVRQKIELQAAVDNAAYAGALVQADTLSRIAVLNRALAWTYVQTNRRHTDYLMNRYSHDILRAFWFDSDYASQFEHDNSPRACPRHRSRNYIGNRNAYGWNSEAIGLDMISSQIPGYGYNRDDRNVAGSSSLNKQYGVSSSSWQWASHYNMIPHGDIAVSSSSRSDGYRIRYIYEAARDGVRYPTLETEISAASRNMYFMNRQIQDLIREMNRRIFEAVRQSVNDNHTTDSFLLLVGGMAIREGDYHADQMEERLFECPSETVFLSRHYKSAHSSCNQDGWAGLGWWPSFQESVMGKRSGFYRAYTGDYYVHSWKVQSFIWDCQDGCKQYAPGGNPDGDYAPATLYTRAARSVRLGYFPNLLRPGASATDPWGNWETGLGAQYWNYNRSITIRPRVLLSNFFGKDGSIVVAAKRPVQNPFSLLFGSPEESEIGFYGAYRYKDAEGIPMPIDLWAVAASRAGVRNPGAAAGEYHATWQNEGGWNLFVDDWDAVILPLAKAWKFGENGKWSDAGTGGENASDILAAVRTELRPVTFTTDSNEVNYDVLH